MLVILVRFMVDVGFGRTWLLTALQTTLRLVLLLEEVSFEAGVPESSNPI